MHLGARKSAYQGSGCLSGSSGSHRLLHYQQLTRVDERVAAWWPTLASPRPSLHRLQHFGAQARSRIGTTLPESGETTRAQFSCMGFDGATVGLCVKFNTCLP